MYGTITPLFPGLPGGPEVLVVLLILVLLFGANKIPKLARSTGQAMGEFRRGREEIEEELSQMEGDDEEEEEKTTSTSTETSTETN
ncbi:twin-arginine translocase TatA/TatE family subunit [Halobellus limi]|jgi:sec-independent protein translocase protein TatA|uniref:Sec-independent protein translocase protein TatA n=1 Tax=Halobellus limi TaxID=699433 RepID=A0A1H5YZ81_9EURY|nr:twin-arginine translocase TatA/TatE family subunit [Halobellus limi]QCC48298.1 twin-arginine translocase TatA/TatE family subunit [Halobellus limi]SEG28745.1 sec-independent protein translocase protein TatA [Halobellus limi]